MSEIIDQRPVLGFTCGDINGIGIELIIKTLSDNRILDLCIPIVYANNKVFNFYRKSIPENNISFSTLKDGGRINDKQLNMYNCWEEEVAVTPGVLNETGGKYAIKSLTTAAESLKAGKIDGLITAPIHKNNVQSSNFSYTGHTPYFKQLFGAKDVAMFLVSDNLKVALLTEHLPVKDIAQHITKENIFKKLQIVQDSLKKDFGISKPKIAVLALNPHAGDEGLIGKEEKEIIAPAIADAKQKNMLCFGPFAADAFFARGHYQHFDAVLAMYHDQGLIPFKSLAIGEGVNFTAGISGIRTSPDHGVAFDIAGKNMANESSFRQSIFTCIDIIKQRNEYATQYSNPLKKISASMLAKAVDQKITEIPE